jgi:uncharacterized alpha-E superfamily protein
MMLDMPTEISLSAGMLIDISGASDLYAEHYKKVTDRNVYRFLLANKDTPASIYSCIIRARENTRVIRDQMPAEFWEGINELYRFVKRRYESKNFHKTIYRDLSDIKFRCQQFTGLLAGTMSQGSGYQFIKIGRNLERADMTTRILDTGAVAAEHVSNKLEPLRNRLWREILQSLSAHQMYRKNVKFRVVDERVIEFVLFDSLFPRSVLHCIEEIEHCFRVLPRSNEAIAGIKKAKKVLMQKDLNIKQKGKLHTYIDELQVMLGEIHEIVEASWFTR